MSLQKFVPIILAVLAIVALAYLFMNNDMSSNQPSQTMRNVPMRSGVENFYAKPNHTNKPHTTKPKRSEDFEDYPQPPEFMKKQNNVETFVNTSQQQSVSGSEEIQYIAQPQSLGESETGSQMNQLPSECYPKDVLSSVDLLPRDANSLWAQVNPSGQGSLADQNFLTSGFHIGINTVGQTLRNANRQLRSEPLNPQVKVSPWMQTTIDPDINRRPLEISSGEL
jgi:hypothetical protein